MKSQERLFEKAPAANWNEAYPLGNGRIGAMIFDGTADDVVALSEDTLWTGRPDSNYPVVFKDKLPELRRLLRARKYTEASQILRKLCGDYRAPGFRDSATFVTAGNLTSSPTTPGRATTPARWICAAPSTPVPTPAPAARSVPPHSAAIPMPSLSSVFRSVQGERSPTQACYDSPIQGHGQRPGNELCFDGVCPAWTRKTPTRTYETHPLTASPSRRGAVHLSPWPRVSRRE